MIKVFNMDFLSASLLGGFVYDCFKTSVLITADNLKVRLKNYIFDDEVIERLASKINELDLAEYGEGKITKELEKSSDIQSLLPKIQVDGNSSVINQYHSGTGDNVAGDKVITVNK